MALATSIAGCQFATERPSLDAPASDRTEGQVTLHQAGQVLAGTPIVHAFPFQNPTDRKLRLVDQDDVRPSCGCAHVRVIDYELEPGASTAVTVRVRTEGRQGPLAEAVSVTWTSETGQRWEHVFAIRGQVRSALRFTPDELSFDKSEVARAVRKQVSCTSDCQWTGGRPSCTWPSRAWRWKTSISQPTARLCGSMWSVTPPGRETVGRP